MKHHLLDLVVDFWDAASNPDRLPSTLSRLTAQLGGDACFILWRDLDRRSARCQAGFGIGSEALDAYERKWSAADVWLQHDEAFRSTGCTVEGNSIVAEKELLSSEFFHGWLRPLGLAHALLIVLHRSGGDLVILNVLRRQAKGEFPEQRVSEARALAPALSRAFRAASDHLQTRALKEVLQDALNRMPIGVAIVNGSGTVLAANQAAQETMAAGDPIQQANGSLVFDRGTRRVRLSDLLTDAHGFAEQRTTAFSLLRRTGLRPITVVVTPLPANLPLLEEAVKPRALLFLGDPERTLHFDATRIAELYGLSRAESRVAALLASGYRLEQVGEILGIAYETVRKHLKQIFGKTATYRQAELVRMLVTGPAGCGS